MDTVTSQSRWQEQSFRPATGSAHREWLDVIPARDAPRVQTSSADAAQAVTRTALGAKLREIRARALASGQRLLSWDEIEQEIAERRGRPLESE